MWVLVLMIITAKGNVAVYDQGIFKKMDECLAMHDALLEDDFQGLDNVKLSCIRWVK